MRLVIKTYLRTRMPDGTSKTWLSNGQPCVTDQGDSGYQSVAELRHTITRRNKTSHLMTEIDNGIKIVPLPGYGQGYAHQEITLET